MSRRSFVPVAAALAVLHSGVALAVPQPVASQKAGVAGQKAGVAGQSAAPSGSHVKAVMVYPDRARATRVRTVAVAPGPQEVVFTALPAELMAESVRASGTGTAQAAISGLDVRTIQLGAPAESRTRDLERRIREHDDRENDLGIEIDSLKLAQRFVRDALQGSGKILGATLASRSFDPKEWSGPLAIAENQDLRLSRAILKAQRAQRDAAEARKLLARELSALRGFRARSAKEVRVFVDVARAGDLDVEITYDVPGAAWQPTYDIVLDPGLAKATLSYRAQVTQRTGEDWPDVRVALSSGRPDLGAAPPSLGSWVLDRLVVHPYGDEKARRDRAAAAGAGRGEAMSPPAARSAESRSPADEPDAQAEEEPIAVLEAGMRQQGTAVQFEAARAVTLPADGRPHQVPIGERELAAHVSYRVVPRYSPHAYLTAELANSTPWPLLAGTVRAHVGQDFVGTAALPEDIAPAATWSVALGADRQIKVSRLVLKRMAGERGFIVNKRRQSEYEFKIALHNQKATPVALEVVEPVPVSRREEIKVRFTGQAKPPAPTAPQGELRWDVVLAPGEKREIVWGYAVEWPEDLQIAGLE